MVRTTLEALSAVLGGTQSLHTNGYDEALSLPTAEAATLALRTQQIIAYESGIPAVADPLGGSYYVEALTDDIQAQAQALIDQIAAAGGAVEALEQGLIQGQIADAAYDTLQAIQSGAQIVVGVNRWGGDQATVPVFLTNDAVGEDQRRSLVTIRAGRDGAAVDAALADVRRAAEGTANLLVPMHAALRLQATIGEVCGVLRAVWGEYRPAVAI